MQKENVITISKGKDRVEEGLKLIPKNEYRSVLRKYLPEDSFKPEPKHFILYFICMLVYFSSMYFILHVNLLPVKLLISILMGIALSSLTFFLHDLFHGSITGSKSLSYVTGLTIGVLNLFAPLFWQRVHNLHHATTGNINDPDRSYILSEAPKNKFEKFMYTLRLSNESIHPFFSLVFMSTGFFWYFLNTMFYGLIPMKNLQLRKDLKYQTIKDVFKKDKDKLIVLLELIIIFAFQVFLFFFIAKSSFINYFLISLLPVGIAHFVAMSYIHTNHFLSPLTGEIDDPLINSLSLKNSTLVDKIFSNFSHHVEHHLFPAMSSLHYPEVRKLLLKLYPERFQLIPMIDAMKSLLKTPRIYGDFTTLITSDGSQRIKCLLPRT